VKGVEKVWSCVEELEEEIEVKMEVETEEEDKVMMKKFHQLVIPCKKRE